MEHELEKERSSDFEPGPRHLIVLREWLARNVLEIQYETGTITMNNLKRKSLVLALRLNHCCHTQRYAFAKAEQAEGVRGHVMLSVPSVASGIASCQQSNLW